MNIEMLYDELVIKIFDYLSNKYGKTEIRYGFLGEVNSFCDTDGKSIFSIRPITIYIGSIYDKKNTEKFLLQYLEQIFIHWKKSCYKELAIYYEGTKIIDNECNIIIGATLYNLKTDKTAKKHISKFMEEITMVDYINWYDTKDFLNKNQNGEDTNVDDINTSRLPKTRCDIPIPLVKPLKKEKIKRIYEDDDFIIDLFPQEPTIRVSIFKDGHFQDEAFVRKDDYCG